MTTALVTGGAGFIGSNLADRLLAEDHRVIAVDDLSTGRIANLAEARGYGKGYTFFNMDVRAEGLLPCSSAIGPRSSSTWPRRPACAPRSTIRSTTRASTSWGRSTSSTCARRSGARKVVYAASGGTLYGEPKRIPVEGIGGPGLPPAQPLRGLEEGRARLPRLLPAVPGARLHGPGPGQRLRPPPGPARGGGRDRHVRLGDAGRRAPPRSSATATRPATTSSSTTSSTRSPRRWTAGRASS